MNGKKDPNQSSEAAPSGETSVSIRPIDLQMGILFIVCSTLPLVTYAAARELQEFVTGASEGGPWTFVRLPNVQAVELSGRFMWIAGQLFLWALCLAALFYLVINTRTFLQGSRRFFAACMAVILIGAVAYALWVVDQVPPYHALGKDLFIKTVGETLLGANSPADFTPLIKWFNTLSGAGAVFIAVGAATLVGRDREMEGDTAARKCRVLARQVGALRNYLFLGSVMLLVSLVTMHLFFLLPVPFIAAGQHDQYRQLVQGLISYFGIVNVLILIAAFGPAMLALNSRGHQIADEALGIVKMEEHRDWRVKHGLVATVPTQVTQALAMALPLLGSPIGSIISGMMA